MNDSDMLTNLAQDLAPLWHVGSIIALIMGLTFFGLGLVRLMTSGSSRFSNPQVSPVSWLYLMVGGAFLLAIQRLLNMAVYTFFQQSAPSNVLEYAPASQDSNSGLIFSIVIIHLVGFYGVVKGVALISTMGEKRGGEFGAACWMIVGGAFALRIDLLFRAIGVSMGGPMESVTQNLFA